MPVRDMTSAARNSSRRSVGADLRQIHRFTLTTSFALIAVLALGLVFDIDTITRVRSSWPEISPYTVGGFAVLAVALVLLDSKHRLRIVIGRVLAGFTLVLGASLDFSVNSGLLPSDDVGTTNQWNWVSLLPSVASMAVAASVLLIDVGGTRISRLRVWLAVFAGTIALLGLLSFVYGSATIFEHLGLSGTSLPTTLVGLLLIGAALTARPDQPPLSTLDARYDAILLRRVLPMLLVAPFIPAAVARIMHWIEPDNASAEAVAQLITVVILCAVVIVVGGSQSRTLRDLTTVRNRVWGAFANTPVSTCIVSQSGRIGTANAAMGRTLGMTEDQLVDIPFIDLVIDFDKPIVKRKLAKVLAGDPEFRADVRLRRANGSRIWVDLGGGAALDNSGNVAYVIVQFTDLTDRKQLERVLAEQASRDSLTGLLNRDGFDRRLDYMQQHLSDDQVLAIVFADVDGLKPLNDDAGHAAGDDLLREVARRLQSVTRDDDLVARVGGDEFVIVTSLPKSEAGATDALVERLRLELNGPVIVGQNVVNLSVSLGAAIHDREAEDASAAGALAAADRAMYQDKYSRRLSDKS